MSATKDNCPDESQLLAFCDGTLWAGGRKRVEKHLAECDRCRESLALLVKAAQDAPEEASQQELERQSALVMGMVERDRGRVHEAPSQDAAARSAGMRRWIWAGAIAMAALAIGVPVGYRVYIDNLPVHQAMAALMKAQLPGRRIQGRLSGGLPHSAYHATRGDSGDDSMQYDRAEHLVKNDPGSLASGEGIQVLARVQLARSRGDDANQALKALQDLAARRGLTPELANDIGIAFDESGDPNSALNYYSKALSLRPGYPEALFNKALVEEELFRNGEAAEDWRAYIHESPQSDDWLAEAQENLQDLEQRMHLQPH